VKAQFRRNDDAGPQRPGTKPDELHLPLTFEEAVSRAMKVPKPQEEFPDFRKRRGAERGEQEG
jgi:hypothetical protein